MGGASMTRLPSPLMTCRGHAARRRAECRGQANGDGDECATQEPRAREIRRLCASPTRNAPFDSPAGSRQPRGRPVRWLARHARNPEPLHLDVIAFSDQRVLIGPQNELMSRRLIAVAGLLAQVVFVLSWLAAAGVAGIALQHRAAHDQRHVRHDRAVRGGPGHRAHGVWCCHDPVRCHRSPTGPGRRLACDHRDSPARLVDLRSR